MAASSEPLSFAVVIPVWEQSEGFGLLRACPYLRGEVRVPKEDHAWRDNRAGGMARRVPVDTGIFFVQNDAGASKWPASEAALGALREALVVPEV